MNIKKFALPALALAVVLSGCGRNGSDPESTSAAETTLSTTQTTRPKVTVEMPVSSDGTWPSVIFTVPGQTTAQSTPPLSTDDTTASTPPQTSSTSASTSASSSTTKQSTTSATTKQTTTSRTTAQSTTNPPSPPPVSGNALPVAPPGTELHGLTREQAEAFWSDAVFVGDSIMMHWTNYMTARRDAASYPDFGGKFFNGAKALTAASLGVNNALWAVSSESVHPKYQGQQMQLWNSIPLTGAKKVAMMFGMNDVALYGVSASIESYGRLIDLIKTNAPEAEFYIVSATYPIKNAVKKSPSRDLLRDWNLALIDFCRTNGYNFINLTDALCDDEGYLRTDFCNDSWIHQTSAARVVWADILRGYAADRLTGN